MKSMLLLFRWFYVWSGIVGGILAGSPNDLLADPQSFVAKWNVPSASCFGFNCPLDPKHFNILTNQNQSVNGSVIVLFFKLGLFPIIENGQWVNGGVPQNGNLSAHLAAAERNINEMIPDPNFNGSAVIDFEDWRPVWELTAGTQQVYKDASIQLVRQAHPDWTDQQVIAQAQREYENAGREYLYATLALGKRLRPLGGWGYYGYPYVDNYEYGETGVSQQYQRANDQLAFLINNSTSIFVSIYTFKYNLTSEMRGLQVQGRIDETLRVRKINSIPIFPYWWYSYHEVAEYLTESDVEATIGAVYNNNLNGVIIWGGSGEVNSYAKCRNLTQYLNTILGPYVSTLVSN